MQVQLCKT